MTHVIDHCEMSAEIQKAGHNTEDVMEMALERSGEIVKEAVHGGEKSVPHELPGIELLAQAVASSVIHSGAKQVAGDLGLDLDRLRSQALAEHISVC